MRTGTLQNPFAGLLKCANCGRAIVINTSNETVEKYRLCCRTLDCNKASALSIVEDKVFEVLTKEFKDIELSLKNIRQSHNKDKLSCLDTIATLETELKKLDKQQLRLYDLLEQEVYVKNLNLWIHLPSKNDFPFCVNFSLITTLFQPPKKIPFLKIS